MDRTDILEETGDDSIMCLTETQKTVDDIKIVKDMKIIQTMREIQDRRRIKLSFLIMYIARNFFL